MCAIFNQAEHAKRNKHMTAVQTCAFQTADERRHAAVKQIVPTQRHETPLIGRLEIMDGHVGYIDQKRKLDLSGTVSTATGQAGAEPEARLSLNGSLEGQKLSLDFVGGSALMLRQTDK